ncbi:dUTP diphosphatase [Acidiphilium multivorum]|uniref:dUTP diphosphatase n=1 Tax=Acidiphilium multivorum TaxID=62140 RepID=UPI001F4C152A|nr:dUTP diphosphatase [Acidiphilium multivorum]
MAADPQEIYRLASSIGCPRHVPRFSACRYDGGEPCECRLIIEAAESSNRRPGAPAGELFMPDPNFVAHQQVFAMMDLQDQMNRVVDENWIELRRPWYRAAWIEAGELMGHLKVWKWWGTPHPDYEQAEIEVVDILHFMLSSAIEGEGSLDAARSSDIVSSLVLPNEAAPDAHDVTMRSIETFVKAVLRDERASPRVLAAFVDMASRVGVSQSRAYRLYVGKNVLNVFRQKNGYKTGSYVKIWDGREDNEHLAEILSGIDLARPDAAEAVMRGLDDRYRAIVAA